MATIPATTTHGEGVLYSWPNLATNDDGTPVGLIGSGDRTFVAFGTFGGGTVTLQGSFDQTNWFTLRDPQGANIALTAAGIRAVMEAPIYVRPLVTGGTGVSISCQLLVRRK